MSKDKNTITRLGTVIKMSEAEQKRIFSKNLDRIISASGHTRKEVADALGFNYKTFNGWCNGISMPSMGKVQKIADYFHLGKTDFLDEHIEQNPAPISAQFVEKNRPESALEDMRVAYARNRSKLTKEERMKLAAEILQDEEDI